MTPDLIRYKSICKIYQEAHFYVVWILLVICFQRKRFLNYLNPKREDDRSKKLLISDKLVHITCK